MSFRIKKGDSVHQIILPSIKGNTFDSNSLSGKPYLLSFFRFASCPFCNLRVNQLVRRYDEFGDDFTIVAIFDSPIENLIKHAEGHHAQFPILADERNQYYKLFAVERSWSGMLKGMLFRLPTLLNGMINGYLPIVFKGNLLTMPVDILVDRNGIVQLAYYGKDEGDHLSFEKIRAFSSL